MKTSPQYLSSISKDQISFRVFFAVLSFYEQKSSFLSEIIISLIEYLQLVSQLLLISFNLNDGTTTSSYPSNWSNFFVSVSKLFSFRSFLSFGAGASHSTLLITMVLLLTLTLAKCGLVLYIVIISMKRKQFSPFLTKLWRWTFRIQGKVLFFPVSSIWFNIFQAASEGELNIGKPLQYTPMVISMIVVALEFLSSIFFKLFSYYPLPTKNFMSAKSKTIEIMTIFQKFILQILGIILTSRSLSTAWVLISTSLACCIIRDFYYIKALPLYRLHALLYQAGLLMMVTSLNVASFIEIIMRSVSFSDDTNFVVFTWVILMALSTWGVVSYIKRRMFGLVGKSFDCSSRWIIHKFILNSELFKLYQTPGQMISKYSFSHLLNMTELAGKHRNHNTPVIAQADISSKQSAHKLLSNYIEGLLQKFPGNSQIKLFAGYYYAKKLKQYGVAMRILTELQHSSSKNTAFSASILIYSLQKTIIARYKANINKLDLYSYVQNLETVVELKAEMVKQADLHIDLSKEFNKSTQDLGLIFNHAQKIDYKKKVIEKKIKKMFEVIPDSYIEPSLLIAYYYLELNHSLSQYSYYSQNYVKKAKKYEKNFKCDLLGPDNLYQSSNRLMVISGDKKDLGKVMFSSKSLMKVYGQTLSSRHICAILHPYVQNTLSTTINNLLEQGDTAQLSNILATWTYNPRDEHLYPLNIHMDIHPFLSQGLMYIAIGRLSKSLGDKIIVKQNGDIIGFTKTVGAKLGLSTYKQSNQPKELNISFISEELARANQAFSMVSSRTELKKKEMLASPVNNYGEKLVPQTSALAPGSDLLHNRRASLSFEWNMQLYLAFGAEGATLELQPLAQARADSNTSHSVLAYTYHCKMEHKSFGPVSVQIVTLHEVHLKRKPENSQLEGKSKEKTELQEEESQVSVESSESSDHSEGDQAVEAVKVSTEVYNLQTETRKINNLVTTEQDAHYSTRKLLKDPMSPDRASSRFNQGDKEVAIASNPILSPTKPIKTAWNDPMKRLMQKDEYSTSRKHKSSTQLQLKISKAFENALNTKYYPYYYRLFLIIAYTLGIVSFISQALLSYNANRDIEEFGGRKNIIRIAEARNDILVKVQGVVRNTWVFATGQQDESKYPEFVRSSAMLNSVEEATKQLSSLNQNLMLSLNDLDNINREKLFEKDIEMFESDPTEPNVTSSYFNNFQATERIVETSFRAIKAGRLNVSDAVPDFNVILWNALNNLFVRSDAATDMFVSLSLDKRDEIMLFTTFNLFVSLSFFMFSVIIFIIISIKQNMNEQQNMLMVTKLNKNQVWMVFDRVIGFKAVIEQDGGLDWVKKLNIYDLPFEEIRMRFYEKDKLKLESRLPNSQRITRKYQWYVCKFLILMMVFSIFVILRFTIVKACINSLVQDLSHIYFSDRLRTKVHLGGTISSDLTARNISLVRNNRAADQFLIELDSINSMRSEIATRLREEDLTYDAFVEESLFGDTCNCLKSKGFYPFCLTMKKEREKVGLIVFLSDFDAILTGFYTDYQQINKTTEALAELEFKTFDSRMYNMVIIVDLLETVGDRFDGRFNSNLEKSQTLNYVSSSLVLVSIVILCFLTHVWILNPIREAENDFRKVLKVFPARLVLSNFIFKAYLLKTSQRVLDSIKNDI